MRNSWIVSVCIAAVLASVADAWTCGITLIGNSTEPQSLTFSKAAVNCTRGDYDSTSTLQAWIHPSLQSATFEGKRTEPWSVHKPALCTSVATAMLLDCCLIQSAAVLLFFGCWSMLQLGLSAGVVFGRLSNRWHQV